MKGCVFLFSAPILLLTCLSSMDVSVYPKIQREQSGGGPHHNPSMEKRSHTGQTKRFIRTSVMWGYTHKQTSKGWPWWWLVSSNVAVKISWRKVVKVFIISRSAVVRCAECYWCLKNRAAAVKPSRGRNSHKTRTKGQRAHLLPHSLCEKKCWRKSGQKGRKTGKAEK